jgi:hypothetical protein
VLKRYSLFRAERTWTILHRLLGKVFCWMRKQNLSNVGVHGAVLSWPGLPASEDVAMPHLQRTRHAPCRKQAALRSWLLVPMCAHNSSTHPPVILCSFYIEPLFLLYSSSNPPVFLLYSSSIHPVFLSIHSLLIVYRSVNVTVNVCHQVFVFIGSEAGVDAKVGCYSHTECLHEWFEEGVAKKCLCGLLSSC